MVTVDVEPTAAPVAGQAEQGAALEGLLGPTLDELEAVRARNGARDHGPRADRVPAGLAVGLALSLWLPESDGFDVAVFILGGGLAGYSWAAYRLSEAYRRLYKNRVLPALAARFGTLAYRKPERLDAAKLRRHGLFEAFDRLTAEDEIHGERHGLPVSIIELRLTRREGKHEKTVFDGLLAEVALPRNLSGVTAVIADGGVFGGLRNLFGGGADDRVRLEDPVFEQRYEVYWKRSDRRPGSADAGVHGAAAGARRPCALRPADGAGRGQSAAARPAQGSRQGPLRAAALARAGRESRGAGRTVGRHRGGSTGGGLGHRPRPVRPARGASR
jgi:hypothetical protein